jgi:hypothetical protein
MLGSDSRKDMNWKKNAACSTDSGSTYYDGYLRRKDGVILSMGMNWKKNATWSTDSGSTYYEGGPQYDDARATPDLPSGYLRRKDGVILSMGSSMEGRPAGSVEPSERYVNPENAAQSLVENLESRGYKFDEKAGIIGSASVSTNRDSDRYRSSLSKDESAHSDRYRLSLSKDESAEQSLPQKQSSDGKGRSWGEEAVAVFRAKAKPLFDNASLVSREGSKESSQTDSVFRAKAKGVSKDRATEKKGRSVASNSIIETGSRGSNNSKRSAAGSKQSTKSDKMGRSLPPNSIIETGSRGSNNSKRSAAGSKQSTKSEPTREFDASILMNDSVGLSEEGTDFDESTISSKEQTQFAARFEAMKRTNISGMTEMGIMSIPSETVADNKTVSIKRVAFMGEFPQLTSKGTRVPELVRKPLPDGVLPSVSDLSSMPRSGQSTLSSLSFQDLTEDRIERFFEKMWFTCRMAAMQP